MSIIRRFPILAIAALALVGLGTARAQYPERPVQIIVPFGAGDAIDGTARVIAERLREAFGVPFIVRNMAGAGGGVGTAEAAAAEADGHTLLMGSTGALTARPLMADSGYRTEDFVPIAQLVEVPIALAVGARSPYGSLAELFDAAAAAPGAIKYSTPGPGSTQHVSMELFADEHGIELVHIGGGGGTGAVTKALSGEVDFAFVGASNFTSLAEAGQLRVLGVASRERVDYLSEAPTFAEQGYDFESSVWFGLLVRAGTPEAITARLAEAVAEVARADATRELYRRFNFNDAYLDPEQFAARIAEAVESNRIALEAMGLAR